MVPRTQRRQRHHSYGAVVGEITVKLVVNMVLSAAAIAALVQLLPYHLSQQAKLREVRAEVNRTEKRVNDLRTDFGRSFDNSQANSVMREQSYRVDPNQRQVVWQEGGTKDDN
jgi:cell division protein FtsB